MSVFTDEQLMQFRRLGKQSLTLNPQVVGIYTNGELSISWYVTEYYPATGNCFGLVQDAQQAEWVIFPESELTNTKHQPLEEPIHLSGVQEHERRHKIKAIRSRDQSRENDFELES